MGDLISREALKNTIIGFCGKCSNIITKYENGVPDGNCAIHHILSIIDNAPTVENITVFCENADEKAIADMKEELQKVIDDLRPQGEWIKKFNEVSYWYECDQCGERPARNYLGDDYLSRFCPNCGSQMQEGGAE